MSCWLRPIFIRGRTGLPRRSSLAAMTRGSSSRSCLQIRRLPTSPVRPSVRSGRHREQALAAERSGVIRMLPPTMSILIELADLSDRGGGDQSCARAPDRACAAETGGSAEMAGSFAIRRPVRREIVMTSAAGSGAAYVQLIRAPNPGPMTLDGTNTWVITDADEGALVVDPGPAIESHLEAVLAACEPRLRRDRADPPAS